MTDKKFKIKAEDIKQLIDFNSKEGINRKEACFASDDITVNGKKVGFMCREDINDKNRDIDSGWSFFSGQESEEFLSDSKNFEIYSLNTIANYDKDILSLLDSPIGSEFIRNEKGVFVKIEK